MELVNLCHRAAQAVGDGALAINVIEDPKRGYLVNEINHTMGFFAMIPLTGIDLPGLLVDYTLKLPQASPEVDPSQLCKLILHQW